jgi:alpha-tubulin suppressor-like RCC1 family protein
MYDCSRTPIPQDVVGLSDIATQITADDSHTCARLQTGQVQCWGYNDSAVLGDGTDSQRNYPVTGLNLTAVNLVSIGYKDACAVSTTGSLSCWGTRFGQSPKNTGSNVDLVAVGPTHICFSSPDGSVQCAGSSG